MDAPQTPPVETQTVILFQVVKQPTGEIQIVSALPAAAITELMIKLLPTSFEAARAQFKAVESKIAAPPPNITDRLRHRSPHNGHAR